MAIWHCDVHAICLFQVYLASSARVVVTVVIFLQHGRSRNINPFSANTRNMNAQTIARENYVNKIAEAVII